MDKYFSIFGHQNPGSGLDPDSLEMLDLDSYPDPDSINPQHWIKILWLTGMDYLNAALAIGEEEEIVLHIPGDLVHFKLELLLRFHLH